MNLNEKYTSFCKPKLGKLLGTIRLDKTYHRAEGDYIIYSDISRNEVPILDFLGGYGASLFGHNHPELIEMAISNLTNKMPFNAQISCRGQAAILSEKLNKMMFERTKKNFVITLANSGTEAIEIAIKHAEYQHRNKLQKFLEETKNQISKIKKNLHKVSYKVSDKFYDILNEKTGILPTNDIHQALWNLENHNNSAFEKISSFIAFQGSFHGKSTGSVNLTHNHYYREPFKKIGISSFFVKPGDIDSIKKIVEGSMVECYILRIDSTNKIHLEIKKQAMISGVFIEPIQGEGGINVMSNQFLKECRALTSEYGISLIFDEIQCGMGRTGTFLFSEQLGVTADYYTLSKSFGGGISKIAALLVDADLYEKEFSMIHSSTFAEDDHSASIAIKALEILERNEGELYKNCTKRGEQLLGGLYEIMNNYPSVIKSIRGKGLMLGIEFHQQDDTDSRTFKMLSSQNLLGYVIAGYLLHEQRIRVAPTLSSTTTIRLEPSAFISKNECHTLLEALKRMCEIMQKKNTYEFMKFMVGSESYNDNYTIKNYRIEQRNGNFPIGNNSEIAKVAFLGHFIEASHMRLWDNGLSDFSDVQLEELVEKLYELVDPVLSDEYIVTSATGDKVSLCFLGLIFTSKIITRHMKNADLFVLNSKINLALDLAKSLNCRVVGFGGYSSIITSNCKDIVTDSLALTTGNSLTVAMGIEALYTAAEKTNIDLETSCFAAIGAAGNISSIYSEIIAKITPRIILIGSPERVAKTIKVAEKIYQNALEEILEYNKKTQSADKEPLKGVAKSVLNTKTVQEILRQETVIGNSSLYERIHQELGEKSPVIVTSEYKYLKESNLILGASNSPHSIIFPEMLDHHEIVICDIAVPGDVDELVTEKCKNVFVIKGGLVKLPLNPDFAIGGVPLDKGEAFACMSETLLMGLSGIYEDYSIGSINKNQVNKIMQIAKIHGFKLGKMKIGASL